VDSNLQYYRYVSKHLESLNDAQKAAVLHTEGPLLVLAGAGAGKTKVITHRILEIVRGGTAPEEILAVTFTNKAAREMRERVTYLLQTQGGVGVKGSSRHHHNTPFVSTFHSLGLTIIKENAKALGFTRTPAIYDRADSLRAIKAALKSVGMEDIEARAALSFVSRHKGDGVTAEAYAEDSPQGRESALSLAWLAYEKSMRSEGALDFDDLLLCAMHFLRKDTTARERYQTRWRYAHIDEYQDTNNVQAQLATLLVGPQKNICAVGDIDQTIYSWRGAKIRNMLEFEKTYPNARIILLEENYRSTKNILAAANDVIAKNMFRQEKNLFTKNPDGKVLSLYQAFDEVDEASFVVRKVLEQSALGRSPKDFAVLYRANFQSRALEEAFLAAEVPYQVVGTRFFERKEVKDVLALVRAALYDTPQDIARVANVPVRGIGKVTLLKMLAGREGELSGAVREKVAAFRTLLARIKDAAKKLPPSKLVQYVVAESGIERMLKDDKLEGTERLENVRELASLATRYDSLPLGEGVETLLESAALASDQDELKDDKNAVRLMTVHAAKGLEFPIVFITGLEEGLFPYARDPSTSSGQGGATEDKEEERRLMYVAITRAKLEVYLTYAAYRTIFGSKQATLPSQFLSDIPDHLLELETPERLGKTIYLD